MQQDQENTLLTHILKGLQWPVPAIGLGICGVGLGGMGNIVLTYLVDSYRDVSVFFFGDPDSGLISSFPRQLVGDGMIGVIFVRNALATLTTTCLGPWVTAMGLQNMFIMSGCLSIGIYLLTIPMIIWGRKFRELTAQRYKAMAAVQSDSRME